MPTPPTAIITPLSSGFRVPLGKPRPANVPRSPRTGGEPDRQTDRKTDGKPRSRLSEGTLRETWSTFDKVSALTTTRANSRDTDTRRLYVETLSKASLGVGSVGSGGRVESGRRVAYYHPIKRMVGVTGELVSTLSARRWIPWLVLLLILLFDLPVPDLRLALGELHARRVPRDGQHLDAAIVRGEARPGGGPR
eukprot:1180212-Prorocentrum_minimum.AAC.1